MTKLHTRAATLRDVQAPRFDATMEHASLALLDAPLQLQAKTHALLTALTNVQAASVLSALSTVQISQVKELVVQLTL